MDEYEYPDPRGETGNVLTTILSILIAALSLLLCLMTLGEAARVGPDVGEIISFDPRSGPGYWSQPGISALWLPVANGDQRRCILSPSVMAGGGGSLVIEAKETSRPPSYRVHWSGPRTDLGERDCGRSADLALELIQLRALATVAGGYGVRHMFGWF
jgi:hypothetical protein